MTKRQTRALLLCGLLLLPFVSGARGQDPAATADDPQAPPESFLESIEVNVVNLLVWVTDKRGNPIAGLSRDDFELFEDGRRVGISNFFAVEGGKPRALPTPTELAPGDTRVTSLPTLSRPHLRSRVPPSRPWPAVEWIPSTKISCDRSNRARTR